MVEERLAACVNILGPCRSIYRWQGAIESASEAPAIFKTTADLWPTAWSSASPALHSYVVPCVAVWPIDKLAVDYALWVEESVSCKPCYSVM